MVVQIWMDHVNTLMNYNPTEVKYGEPTCGKAL